MKASLTAKGIMVARVAVEGRLRPLINTYGGRPGRRRAIPRPARSRCLR